MINHLRKLTVFTVTFASLGAANAELTLIIDSDEQLVGADNIEIGSELFNVRFVEGYCAELFGGCDEASDFLFDSQSESLVASQALLDLVFQDLLQGDFDTNPMSTFGCGTSEACLVLTPYAYVVGAIYATSTSNHAAEYNDRTESFTVAPSSDSTSSSTIVWAAWSVQPVPIAVTIDIKPDGEPNCFNMNGHGVIPVAVLSSATFDAATIDLDTLSFGGLDVRVRGNKGPLCSLEDVNDDGSNDLVCQFQDNSDYWEPGEDEATLTGELQDGTEIEGTDTICIVP